MANTVTDSGYTKTLSSGQTFSYVDAGGTTITASYTGGTSGDGETNCSTNKESLDYNTASCAGHHSSCSTNQTTFSSIVPGNYIQAAHIDELRVAIVDEIDRRNAHSTYSLSNSVSSGDPSPGGIVDNASLTGVNDAINRIDSGSTSIPGNQSDVIITPITALGARIRSLESDCICNSDCACNSVCTCNTDCKCNYSDIRLKTEIEELDKGLEFISSLDTYKFKYKDNDLGIDSLYTHYGLMAQEIPDTNIVHTEASSGYKKVNYIELIPVLINAIKELSEKIDGK